MGRLKVLWKSVMGSRGEIRGFGENELIESAVGV